MNRLWVRLSLAFAAIIVITFGAISFTARRFFNDSNLRSLALSYFERPAGLVNLLEEHYANHGSWQGVSTLMEGTDSALFFTATRRRVLILTDPEGQVLYATAGTERPDHLETYQLQQSLPIRSQGQTVGFLDLVLQEQPLGPLFSFSAPDDIPAGLAEQSSDFMLQMLLIGAILAIVFGVLVNRWLSAPLTHLVDGTQAIARRNLSFRVAEQGSAEMREVSLSFNRMAAALEDAETLRRSMLNDIAHELRTPLSVLEGNLRAILDDVYPLEKAEIARLYDQTRHLHRLVDDLRLLAQAEARQLPLQRYPSNLAVLLKEAAELFSPLAGEKSISLNTNLPRSSVLVAVDRMRLAQTLQNLLANALQHTPAGGVITLSLQTEEETAVIAIADNGEGIAAEDIPHVFDRFYRGDKNRTRDTGGVGLGLAIAQALVKAHDGEIEVASAGAGQGSTFTIRLPLAQAGHPQDLVPAQGEDGPDSRTASQSL
ncbi:MAG: HAMP domain-containing histidine kinase [Caldilineaceae bacterium SB0661_bin_32]|uniref:histidine kinase n=1 Tax=Caldilineaceae bacterium SB0661_bin_32 TaxID=2605255 RepID=A0A6B1D370_9CHLR|nr:HAMP domain-containing histidine kinase [Caldilineaceae bacterium SB0661_bin_32]